MKHISVLLDECINGLNIKENGIYVDMTLGYAGHSSEILKRLKNGFLYAFDKDIDACNYSKERLNLISNNFKIFNTANLNIKTCLENEGVTKVDGILFDLGVSSVELDEASRGFSYIKDAKLDMRMDQKSDFSAYDVVNNYDEAKLSKIFKIYGEEKNANRIARKIVEQRSIKPIETTLELANIIDLATPYKDKRNGGHPAKKVFQAIRIEVNNEIKPLYNCIGNCIDVLKNNGRLAVITFHSLEDRAVKNAFIEAEGVCKCPKDLPYCVCGAESKGKIITKKPILPTENEQNENSRAKSAKLRVFEKKI